MVNFIHHWADIRSAPRLTIVPGMFARLSLALARRAFSHRDGAHPGGITYPEGTTQAGACYAGALRLRGRSPNAYWPHTCLLRLLNNRRRVCGL